MKRSLFIVLVSALCIGKTKAQESISIENYYGTYKAVSWQDGPITAMDYDGANSYLDGMLLLQKEMMVLFYDTVYTPEYRPYFFTDEEEFINYYRLDPDKLEQFGDSIPAFEIYDPYAGYSRMNILIGKSGIYANFRGFFYCFRKPE